MADRADLAPAPFAALRQVTDDDWAEVWPVLLGSQTALAIDFIDRQVPRVYGQPPMSFEDWARLRWSPGDRTRDRLAETYLEQLKPRANRTVIADFRSWALRKWVEAGNGKSITDVGSEVEKDAWVARTVRDRTAKRRADARRHALELGFTTSAGRNAPEADFQRS